LHKLGNFYVGQSKLAEAEAIYDRALQGYKKILGLKYIWTLQTINNLGILYCNQGKLDKAEVMYTRALQGIKEVLEPKHI